MDEEVLISNPCIRSNCHSLCKVYVCRRRGSIEHPHSFTSVHSFCAIELNRNTHFFVVVHLDDNHQFVGIFKSLFFLAKRSFGFLLNNFRIFYIYSICRTIESYYLLKLLRCIYIYNNVIRKRKRKSEVYSSFHRRVGG